MSLSYIAILLFFPFLHYDLQRSCVISDRFDITGQAKASTENCNEHIQWGQCIFTSKLIKAKASTENCLQILFTYYRHVLICMQESQFWKLYKQDQASCSLVVKTSAGLVYLLACLLEPFMPSFSLKVWHYGLLHPTQFCLIIFTLFYHLTLILLLFMIPKVLKELNLPPENQFSLRDENGDLEKAKKPWEILPAGHKIGTPDPLFKELVCIYISSCIILSIHFNSFLQMQCNHLTYCFTERWRSGGLQGEVFWKSSWKGC